MISFKAWLYHLGRGGRFSAELKKLSAYSNSSHRHYYHDLQNEKLCASYMMSLPAEDLFVEAPKGSPNLLFSDEKQQARFELGVSMMIYKWDALETAVQNGWGGPDSAEKRDWITAIIVDIFKNERIVDVPLLEETMLYAMVDEFDTNVEDGSALPIASGIIRVYGQCHAMDYSEVSEMYEKWLKKEEERKNNTPTLVTVQEDPLNPDVSSSDEDEENEENLIEHESGDIEMADGDNLEASQPVVDEDGFELVQKRGKGRRS